MIFRLVISHNQEAGSLKKANYYASYFFVENAICFDFSHIWIINILL